MNEEVMKVIKDTDPIAIMNELEEARRKAVSAMNRPGGEKEDSSVSTFYDLYFRSIVKPVMEHFTGEVKNAHEKGALYAWVNEVFRIVYGRDISPVFERSRSEDHLSGTYKGVAFDQADVVVSKGKEENIFSGRAIQYGFATGIMGKIVIMEKGTFEGIGGGEEQAEKAKDDFSDLEGDGIFGGFDATPSSSSYDHAKSVTNRSGASWANDTANAKLFPGLTKTFTENPAFQERFLVFSDDPVGARRLLTDQLLRNLTGIQLPGNSCLIIDRDRVLLLRNGVNGLMEVDLERPIDLSKELEKNYSEMKETAELLDALREVSAIVAEENSGFEV